MRSLITSRRSNDQCKNNLFKKLVNIFPLEKVGKATLEIGEMANMAAVEEGVSGIPLRLSHPDDGLALDIEAPVNGANDVGVLGDGHVAVSVAVVGDELGLAAQLKLLVVAFVFS